MSRLCVVSVVVAVACLWSDAAAAQSGQGRFDVGGQFVSAVSSEFERSDFGVGGRFSWHPVGLVGVEAEVDVFPRNFPSERPFSRSRTEGLFGVTLGPSFERVRVFAKLRPGFLSFREAPEPLVCILIFPPPLSCALASGHTVFALDVGGGVEVFATRNTFVRVDAGDRLVKYPGPAFDSSRAVHQNAFFGHDFRLAAGGGLRFQ